MKWCSEFCGEWLKETFGFTFGEQKYVQDEENFKDPLWAHKALTAEGWRVITEKPQRGDIIVIPLNFLFMCLDDKQCKTYMTGPRQFRTMSIEALLRSEHTVYRNDEVAKLVAEEKIKNHIIETPFGGTKEE